MRGPIPLRSHGADALRRHGAGGARAEAAAGFPSTLEIGLPALRLGRAQAPGDPEASRVQAFFALLASMEDTNLLHRGGAAGLRHAQAAAAGFLASGGVARPDWREAAARIHHDFIDRRLSAGGCADLLAVTLFLDALETLP
jgi:triphosphoribosyl-dephospho-CoA synthase